MENKAFLSDQDSIHSGEAILESLEKTIEDWELPRSIPVYALRDNSSNMKRAIDLSQALFDLKCFAHNLQLAINDAVKEILGVQNMRTNSRRVVSHCHHSCQAAQKLHSEQKKLGREERELIINVVTRWNSDLFVLQRLTEEKEAITAELIASSKVDNLSTSE